MIFKMNRKQLRKLIIERTEYCRVCHYIFGQGVIGTIKIYNRFINEVICEGCNEDYKTIKSRHKKELKAWAEKNK